MGTSNSRLTGDVQLVGMALAAMPRHPNGLPRYFDKGDKFRSIVHPVQEHKRRIGNRHDMVLVHLHTFAGDIPSR